MLALIDGGAAALAEARAVEASPKATVALAEVRLRAPVPEPRQMRDFLCFEKHLVQAFEAVAKLASTGVTWLDSLGHYPMLEDPPAWTAAVEAGLRG